MTRKRTVKLSAEQLDILRWIGNGCPSRDWPDDTHKIISAYALANRRLALVYRYQGKWRAEITEKGRYFLEHGELPEPKPDAVVRRGPEPEVRHYAVEESEPDSTGKAMRRVAEQPKSSTVKQKKRESKETYMRYKVVVTRVQVIRFVVPARAAPAAEGPSAHRVRSHDLRGAHASWLLAGGADLKAVMDRLGHKQIQTTQQYLGKLPDADDRALAAFEAVRHRRS